MAKLAMVAFLGILCINLSIYLVNEYVLIPEVTYITPILPEDITGKVNINGTVTPSPAQSTAFYDLWGGMGKLWLLISTTVVGIPILLNDMGAPIPVQIVLDALYTVILGIFFIEIVLGRNDILD